MGAPQIPEPLVEYVPDSDPGDVDLEHVDDVDDADDVDAVQVTVEYAGRRYAVRERVSLLPLMRFAVIAKQHAAQQHRRDDTPGADGQREMEALAALYQLLQQCIDPAEFDAFFDHAVEQGAQPEDLMPVVRDAITARAARPTQPPSRSPGGQSTTGTSSAGASSWRGSSVPMGSVDVQRDLEARGRPDLALVVHRAREASSTGT